MTTSADRDVRTTIRTFVLDNVPDEALSDGDDIFERGLVSSMFVMQLVQFVESEFGIVVAGEDLNFDYFRSVDSLSAFVQRKLAG